MFITNNVCKTGISILKVKNYFTDSDPLVIVLSLYCKKA